ncbi:hypothetical protein Hanom_Chr10g00895451 [Helianthus anomalus]
MGGILFLVTSDVIENNGDEAPTNKVITDVKVCSYIFPFLTIQLVRLFEIYSNVNFLSFTYFLFESHLLPQCFRVMTHQYKTLAI